MPEVDVTLFERRPSLGRKLLVAGSSGLNISHRLEVGKFASHYEGAPLSFWKGLFTELGPTEWIRWIEDELGLETFVGTSERYFVREMKAANLLRRWTELLQARGLIVKTRSELTGLRTAPGGGVILEINGRAETFDRVVLAMGGGSWEDATPPWPEILRAQKIEVAPFTSANCGYEVAWRSEFLAEAEGKPLKKIRFRSALGEKDGELTITRYGIEGTPVYFHGATGPCFIDLKPDLTEATIRARLEAVRENRSPLRRAKQKLALGDAALALLHHHMPETARTHLPAFARVVKNFPLTLGAPRPLTEAISSRGGVKFSELHDSLELKRLPGVYCAGEMLDWHAPTGGFLIQASVSLGARAGRALGRSLTS